MLCKFYATGQVVRFYTYRLQARSKVENDLLAVRADLVDRTSSVAYITIASLSKCKNIFSMEALKVVS